jgi:flagella basal body P-ring formation protein FlgA
MFRTVVGTRAVALLACWMALAGAAMAQEVMETPAQVQASARAFLEGLAGERAAATGGIARVQVGAPDVRLKLAACQDLQTALPPGARRSGKTLVVVRCLGGRPWQVFLPAEIHVEAPVWHTAHALPAGRILALDDLVQRSAEIGTDDGDLRPLTVAAGVAIGQTLARPLPEGVVLHASDMLDLSRVAPGDAVNVVYSGTGFSVSGEGKTIGAASPGQSVQVRMAGGTIISGILTGEHVVEVKI